MYNQYRKNCYIETPNGADNYTCPYGNFVSREIDISFNCNVCSNNNSNCK